MKRRRVRLLITAATAVLATAAIGTDLVVAHTAQNRVTHAAANRLKPSGPVSASLETLAGLDALTGNLGTVKISAVGVPRNGAAVNVTANLQNVTTKGTASGGTATVTVPYDQLQRRITNGNGAGNTENLTVGINGTGITLTGTTAAMGIPFTVQTSLTTTSDSVTITPTTVSVLGQEMSLAQLSATAMGSRLAQRLGPHTFKPTMPTGAKITSAQAGNSGLELHLSLPPLTGLKS